MNICVHLVNSILQAKHKTWHVCYKQIQRYTVLTLQLGIWLLLRLKEALLLLAGLHSCDLNLAACYRLILCLLTCFYLWFFPFSHCFKSRLQKSRTVLPQTVQAQIFTSFGYNKTDNPRVRSEWCVPGTSFLSVRSPRVPKWVSCFCQGSFPIQIENRPKISQHLWAGARYQWKPWALWLAFLTKLLCQNWCL